ncbi:FxsA family protein [Streptomyces clavuligerus]|uniref:Putative membrane protein n=5 Tax=Streptomyces clavuligerus TaxID=1901 RepID=E2PUB6_STRCL|nr:FxsA family membrane protein [Streptomyces clavuligerus]ANW21165.1 hypothetical protein BB341_24625 [Streptomyces clavuligerus]AXU15789.1 FxsA family protein [Streptomyces clavuligerus]EFG05735.1 Putative membrane protein [Streptomyces clavuligerus]MBY6305911.1 FxsA family protein [Streptomyces clavuligerus]QCS08570.1 hypothetical protein CRV15_24955 [Streptomyces clavuligerus]
MTTGAMPPPASGPRRSRARAFLPLGVAAWLVLEIWLLTLVGREAGGLAVVALLLGGALVGGALVKRAGRRAFDRLAETVQRQQAGKPPVENGSGGHGFLMLSGLLLMLPGLISDAVGLLLLLPPVRSLVKRTAERSLERRVRAAAPGLQDVFQQAQQARMRRPDGKVVQGEVIRPDGTPGDASRHSSGPEGPRPPLTP